MPSSEEKQHRKTLQNRLKAEAKTSKLAELPVPQKLLNTYFNYLDQELSVHGCDHTLRFTKQFATDHKIDFTALKLWLSKYGGYCDCEALANVEDHFENI